MTAVARALRYVAFAVMTLFGLFGGLFVVGYAVDDPGGWVAVGMTALWVLPLLALSVLAVRRPTTAGPVFVAATTLVIAFTLADSTFGIVPRDDWGPVAAIVVFTIGVALGFLGLRRPALAGLLLMVAGLAQLVATAIGVAVHAADDGPGPGAVLTGSSGVVVLPLLLTGLLFLLAGLLDAWSRRRVLRNDGSRP